MASSRAGYRSVLRVRDFRLLIASALVDAIGGWACSVVLILYIFDRTGSPTWIVAATTASWLPRLLVSTYAGAVADRIERTLVMQVSALGACVCMSIAAVLIANDAPVVLLLAMSVLTSTCTT